MNNKSKNLLVIFLKAPEAGKVKTRLQPELSADQALQLYKAVVADLLNGFHRGLDYDIKLFFAPPDAMDMMQKWLGSKYDFIPQQGKDLGERMHRAFVWAKERGYSKTVLIGSDMPLIGPSTIRKAFEALLQHDVVLGPSQDGGYYLIGLKTPSPEIFQNIYWSTEFVLKQTLEKCRQHNLSVYRLFRGNDIDRFQDVVSYWKILVKQKKRGKLKSVRTFAFLQQLRKLKSLYSL